MEKSKCSSCNKKEDKTFIINCRPISLLPIFGKISERLIYNSLFNYFLRNKRFTPSQSGFLPGDSCIAQLLSILHAIETAFDENPTGDVRDVFLDIFKAFDKVWHDDLIFKSKAYSIKVSYFLYLKTIFKIVNKELF